MSLQGGEDRFEDDALFPVDLGVGETENAKPMPRKLQITTPVRSRAPVRTMLIAIDFYDETGFEAGKIDHKAIDGYLAPDMKSGWHNFLT